MGKCCGAGGEFGGWAIDASNRRLFCNYAAMIEKSEWRDWLATAAKASGKSLRAISLESGNNPGYLHSILATDRDPTVQNLIGICDTIGGSVVSILCEYKLTAEDMEILDALHKSPEVRAGILAILKAQSGSYR